MRFYICLALWLFSCSDGHNYTQTVTLPDSCWTKEQNALFEFATLPGGGSSDVYVFIHTDVQFTAPFASLTVKTIDPNGLFWEDDLRIARIASHQCFRSSGVLLRTHIQWLKQGNYTISIRPNSTLYGVRAIGVNISNVINKPKKIDNE